MEISGGCFRSFKDVTPNVVTNSIGLPPSSTHLAKRMSRQSESPLPCIALFCSSNYAFVFCEYISNYLAEQ